MGTFFIYFLIPVSFWILWKKVSKLKIEFKFFQGLNIASTTSDTEMNGSSSKNMGDSQTALKNEDEIDKILWKEEWDHGIKAGMNKVDALRPDPWDQSFLKEKGIKFMSFHRCAFLIS